MKIKSKKCIRPYQHCNYQKGDHINGYMCNILGNNFKCLDEEEYMDNVLDMKEKRKTRGEKEVARFNDIIKELTEYMDTCPDPSALDRVSDAAAHLRKARLNLMTHYGIDF